MATTERAEDKIPRLLKERLGEIDQLRTLPDDLAPAFRRWRERVLALLKEGVRQSIVRTDLVEEIEYQQFAESRMRMFNEAERSEDDREFYLRGLDTVSTKLDAELERIEEFGGWLPAQPAMAAGRSPTSRRAQSGAVTQVHVGGDNRGVINMGTARDIRVRWDSPEAARELDKLIARVEEIEDDTRHEMLELLVMMKGANHQDERLRLADMVDKLVKLAPAFRSIWQLAKPHLGL